MSQKLGLLLTVAAIAMSLATSASAVTVDLTTEGASGSIYQAYFLQYDPEGAQGTGNFDPFLRVQADTIESGYNTGAKKVEFDTKTGKWTHNLELSTVPIVDGSAVGLTAGQQYREFLLDINETAGSNLLSLDVLRVFVSDTPDLTGYPALGTEIFNLGQDNSVILNYLLNPGSGQGDVAMYLPSSIFTERYVYFYCKFGGGGGSKESSDGFEEWGVRAGTAVPEPGSMMAILCGITGLGGLLARKRR